jgi:hypothetical protein
MVIHAEIAKLSLIRPQTINAAKQARVADGQDILASIFSDELVEA